MIFTPLEDLLLALELVEAVLRVFALTAIVYDTVFEVQEAEAVWEDDLLCEFQPDSEVMELPVFFECFECGLDGVVEEWRVVLAVVTLVTTTVLAMLLLD